MPVTILPGIKVARTYENIDGSNVQQMAYETIGRAVTLETQDALNQPNGILAANLQDALVALHKKIENVSSAIFVKGQVSDAKPLPATDYVLGETYIVAKEGTYAGAEYDVGDFIVCVKAYDAGAGANDSDWMGLEHNIVAAKLQTKPYVVHVDKAGFDPLTFDATTLADGGLIVVKQ